MQYPWDEGQNLVLAEMHWSQGEHDLPARPSASHIIDTLLQLLAWGPGGHREHLVPKEIVVHIGQGST
jgi:hypothetical protein